MKTGTCFVLLASLAACGAALAEGQHLNGDALKQMVVGKTVVLNTPVGGIPISYSGNGTMTGRAKDMQLYTGRERDKGVWWVNADQICQKWDTWLDGRSYCFKLRVDGRTVHWRRNDGHTGTATIASN
ncbi:MAG: hypothetical protein ACKVP7_00130 [Hyphomicrobiaceae bacterium]